MSSRSSSTAVAAVTVTATNLFCWYRKTMLQTKRKKSLNEFNSIIIAIIWWWIIYWKKEEKKIKSIFFLLFCFVLDWIGLVKTNTTTHRENHNLHIFPFRISTFVLFFVGFFSYLVGLECCCWYISFIFVPVCLFVSCKNSWFSNFFLLPTLHSSYKY